MKTKYLLIFMFFIGVFTLAQTQNLSTTNNINKGFQISLRGGYDALPIYNNNTPYIDYKGNWMAGASLDYYFNKNWGIGLDYDYLVNNPKSTYPTNNLTYSGFNITSLNLTENHINRTFLGIGPNYRWKKSDRWNVELKAKGGISTIKGGSTLLEGSVPLSTPVNLTLNHHAGYDAKNVLSAKASVQFNYFVSKWFGMHLGVYHINHFKVPELVDPIRGFSSSYYGFASSVDANEINSEPSIREKSCNCNINSTGVYAGITLRFPKGEKKCSACQYCNVCGKTHEPPMCPPPSCNVCGCKLSITARDKISGMLLNETDIVVQREDGMVVSSGKTNSFGVVVFESVQPGNYIIKGKLYNIDLENSKVSVSDFEHCKSNGGIIQKEILYTDENFIIKGKAVVCNTTTAINGVSVVLKNTDLGVQKSTNTDAKGEFIFQALQNASYSIYGKKTNYLSQTETVSMKDYDRSKTLFIKLEICMDPADCGKTIVLKNILYDLDKFFIREDAKPELNRLVQFMIDNPGVKVELSSHTDSRASSNYNNTLSQNRANAAVEYIISQGISRDRLVGRGYGETRLLNRCADGVACSEPEHQINRRTEVKVLCPNEN